MTDSLSARLSLPLLALLCLPACGVVKPSTASAPFIATFPDEGPGGGGLPPVVLPPPSLPRTPVWNEDAVPFPRTALFGSFPSDVVAFDDTLFTTDADAVEAAGAGVTPVDVAGPGPAPSSRYAPLLLAASDLVDSHGLPGDANAPIGFGFYLNDLAVVAQDLGFVLANAGGSDSSPTCSNLVVFDPAHGTLRQVVDLANPVGPAGGPYVDSSGALVPGNAFTQSGAEGLEFVPTGAGRGRLYVAMSNLVFAAPSYGAVKYPGTVQVFDVDASRSAPVSVRAAGAFVTETWLTKGYNPVSISRVPTASAGDRLLVTVAGTTGYDPTFALVATTPASVEAYDATSATYLGTFDLGLVGLSACRPALGTDAAGHALAYFASSVRGEVYAIRLDGLTTPTVDPTKVAVLRGLHNPIPIDPGAAGGPGGNVAGLALSSDGRTLVATGFGDLFAFPPKPGRIYAIALPDDVVATSGFGVTLVHGTSNLVSTSGRTLGPVALVASGGGGPELYVTVSGTVDLATGFGTSGASLGSLQTFGAIR